MILLALVSGRFFVIRASDRSENVQDGRSSSRPRTNNKLTLRCTTTLSRDHSKRLLLVNSSERIFRPIYAERSEAPSSRRRSAGFARPIRRALLFTRSVLFNVLLCHICVRSSDAQNLQGASQLLSSPRRFSRQGKTTFRRKRPDLASATAHKRAKRTEERRKEAGRYVE